MDNLTLLGEILPELMLEVVAAIICGGLIGLERGLRHKSAGLRDNILICLGAVLFVNVSDLITLQSTGGMSLDPGRIAAQVVTGVGFIGAGVIFQSRGAVTGLTTAATIWVVAAIGLIIGVGQYLLGMLLTALTLLVLTVLNGLEKSLAHRPHPLMLRLVVREDQPELRRKLREVIERHKVLSVGFRAEPTVTGVKLTVQGTGEPDDIRLLVGDLWTLPGVMEVEH